MSNFRLTIAIIGLLGAIIAPPWVPLVAIVALCVRFRAYEAILIGFFVDMLWLPSAVPTSWPLFTIGSITLVWVLEPLRLEFLR